MRTFYKAFYAFIRFLIKPYFFLKGFTHSNYRPKSKTYICLTNHTTNWDFFLAGLVLKRHMYFVASDHIFRNPVTGSIIMALANPIPRKKGGSSDETSNEIKKRLSEGFNVCMMAEGNRTFNGRTGFISPKTAKIVKESGAGLVNVVVRGGYFINPRWGTKKRKGPYSAEAVNEYTPERLAEMSEEEIYRCICDDLMVDAYEDQAKLQADYRCKNPAECLETALFICPECGGISTLKSSKDRLVCSSCSKELIFTRKGYLKSSDGSPNRFSTVYDWSLWQEDELKERLKAYSGKPDELIFTDSGLRLCSLNVKNSRTVLATGSLSLYCDRLVFSDGDNSLVFPLDEIDKISLALRGKFFFTTHGNYYEINSGHEYCALKYLISARLLKGKEYRQ